MCLGYCGAPNNRNDHLNASSRKEEEQVPYHTGVFLCWVKDPFVSSGHIISNQPFLKMASTKVYQAVPSKEVDVEAPDEAVKTAEEQVVEAKVVSQEECPCRSSRKNKLLILLGILGLLFFAHQRFCRHGSASWGSEQRVSFLWRKKNSPKCKCIISDIVRFELCSTEPRNDDGT